MTDWRIYERDVDIVLAEEFYSNSEFANWVLSRSKSFADTNAKVLEVRVSLSEQQGESDLVVIFEKDDDSRFALLIEDKIDAIFQPDQLERYRLRARAGVSDGRWKEFEILLFAPRSYIDRSPIAKQFDSALSLEEIAECMRAQVPGARGEYRADFLVSAAPRGASAYVKVKDPATDAFWLAAYELACREFDVLEMKAPDYARNATWISIRPQDLPVNVRIELKGNRGFADLTFYRVGFDDLESQARLLIEPGMSIHKTGKSPAIRLKFEPFAVIEGIEIVQTKIRSAFEACIRLIRFYRDHRDVFDTLTNRLSQMAQPR